MYENPVDGNAASRTSAGQRLYFFDNLRGFIIFLVIVFHVAIGYMANPPQWWYVIDTQKNLVFDLFVMVTDVFIMPVMFLIAGYFALPVLIRQGTAAFWRNKVWRIIIPWIAGVLLLAPLITYMIFFSRMPVPPPYLDFWATKFFSAEVFNHAHYWFLGDLAWFYLLLTIGYHSNPTVFQRRGNPSRPSLGFFVFFTLITAAGFFGATLYFPPDTWFSQLYIISFQPSRLVICFLYFLLGVHAWRNSWFIRGGYSPRLGPWLASGALMLLLFMGYRISFTFPAALTLKAGHALVHAGFCLTTVFLLIALFQRFVNSSPWIWRRWSANSYTIYYIHQLIVLPLAYLTQKIGAPVWIKYLSVSALSVILCFVAAEYVLGRIPLPGWTNKKV